LLEIELEKFDTLSSEIFAEFDREEQMQLEEVKKKEKLETTKVSGVKKDDFFETMINLRTGDGA
jgi:hypothetical protein